jgi:hypothetical protein
MAFTVFAQAIFGQNYKLEKPLIFKPQEQKVLLFNKNSQSKKLILYYSKLRVNTDGTRKSYHPDDLDGTKNFAINSICNGIAVYKLPDDKNKLACSEAKVLFKKFQNNNWVPLPGYKISWDSVISKNKDGKPCIFQNGEFKGYFGSETAVKNKLPLAERGECGYKNQLDSLQIPNLVLPAEFWKDSSQVIHRNPLFIFEAKKEDLVFAYNPENGVWSYAIIGDVGPNDNLGEGSVSLNMKLLKKTDFPKNYPEAKKEIDTGNIKILVAIIPHSHSLMTKIAKPYTKENIEKRGRELLKEMGFNDEQSFIKFLKEQQSKFLE